MSTIITDKGFPGFKGRKTVQVFEGRPGRASVVAVPFACHSSGQGKRTGICSVNFSSAQHAADWKNVTWLSKSDVPRYYNEKQSRVRESRMAGEERGEEKMTNFGQIVKLT